MSIKSPGGSTFPYYYNGGEIHCLKYGSFFGNHDKLMALMKAEEDFIQSTNRRLRIWIDLYETKITNMILLELVQSLLRIKDQIIKLAIVGLSYLGRWKLNRILKKQKFASQRVAYFEDPEKAKAWLVSE